MVGFCTPALRPLFPPPGWLLSVPQLLELVIAEGPHPLRAASSVGKVNHGVESCVSVFCSAFDFSVCGFCEFFAAILAPFRFHFELRVVPREPLVDPLCRTCTFKSAICWSDGSRSHAWWSTLEALSSLSSPTI